MPRAKIITSTKTNFLLHNVTDVCRLELKKEKKTANIQMLQRIKMENKEKVVEKVLILLAFQPKQ